MNRLFSSRAIAMFLAFVLISLFNVHLIFDAEDSLNSVSFAPSQVLAQQSIAPGGNAWPCTGGTCKSVPGGSGMQSWLNDGIGPGLQVVCCLNPDAFPGSDKKVE